MAGIRVIIHGTLFLLGAVLLGVLGDQTHSQYLLAITPWIRYWSYVPFALAGSCGLHAHKGMTVLLTSMVILIASPRTTASIATCMVPIALGIILGTMIRYFTITDQEHDTTTTTKPSAVRRESGAHDRGDHRYPQREQEVIYRQARSDPAQPDHRRAGIPDHTGFAAGDRRPTPDPGPISPLP